MITWATDYWYLCLAALLIGIATAAWIWLRMGADANADIDYDTPSARLSTPDVAVPAAPLAPVKPVIDVAEPVQFVAAPAATVAVPAAEARPAIAAAVGDPDDLTLIKGVGPKLNALLISLGVTRFDQMANWGASDIAEVDNFLGNFKGRIERDSWIEQAGLLARGDFAGFAAKFGELGSENK